MQVSLTLKKYEEHTFFTERWKKGDPFPVLGKELGVDTETLRTTDSMKFPPLVVTGVYNPEDSTCYIISWEDTPEFISRAIKCDTVLYFANAPFDYFVIRNAMETDEQKDAWQDAVTRGQVLDILIRGPMHEVGTIGFITTYSLADACKTYLKYEIDKHEDEGDDSVRLNFSRDREITEEEEKYLGIDCYTTYKCAVTMGPQATEETQVRGSIVMGHIGGNGFPVDHYMWEFCEKLLQQEMDKYRNELLTYGFPDPYKNKQVSEGKQLEDSWREYLNAWVASFIKESYHVPFTLPSKATIKRVLIYLDDILQTGGCEKSYIARMLCILLIQQKKTLVKAEVVAWTALTEEFEFLDACDSLSKKEVWPLILKFFMDAFKEGKTRAEIWDYVDEQVQERPQWFTVEEEIKPRAFIQEKLVKMEKDYGIVLDRTPKSGDIKFSKKDDWKLQDFNVKDPFIQSYVNFVHVQKYLSSFCNRTHLCSDGKVHPRFGMVETLRSSCSKPNVQQYPSRDKQFPLKNMFRPPAGTVFVSTDYSFDCGAFNE